ncbi:hypothetical protein NEUTE1DRAFT_75224 [Neurospora tetrasperma FGSC 2508]|uniref:Uncharacterized protein n=1 Tax=Neurospora tetrasperma (strain FGSC 2508 / ATCC MYA-4615 / P0657) TaxID=510951 RepID=F8MBI9_NEUT8|nr:uncharacterized protein NEUTE1DRAFT_75224 [Neurospora tetrasperma FGSC 2508]EGO60301.1 hypothetical protein NEUTE1DRAFT_75224 [Neurospora tetrasperma FGSC 2508]EGZ75733.1 hypothetical protein NEUTE2DRAFT_105855 [Neurospora tetrasperma FGSC 2509]
MGSMERREGSGSDGTYGLGKGNMEPEPTIGRDDRAGQAGRQATLLGSDKVGGGAPSRENREAAQYPVLPCTSLTWKGPEDRPPCFHPW